MRVDASIRWGYFHVLPSQKRLESVLLGFGGGRWGDCSGENAAINVEFGSGHVRGFVAGEEEGDRRPNFPRRSTHKRNFSS